MRLLSISALGAALVAAGLLAPAAGEATAGGSNGVDADPNLARPGQRVELSVPGCAPGRGRHWVTSRAFVKDIALAAEADNGHGFATVRRGVADGTYDIVAHCDGRKVYGHLQVSAKRSWPTVLPPSLSRPSVSFGQ
ncbi:hypothetical protein [Spirillospora sp. NPDC047279]|uniref:hypothetical protein n=1 Tax=Spirillospora sp. NPDC047279 TaxID=3155478 RepID=UPI00340DB1B9